MDTICNKKYVLEAATKRFLTLKYLIKEYARLSFLEFLPPRLALFHIINKKFATLFTFSNVIKKIAHPDCLFHPALLFHT